jgi:hypothetical protein
MRSINPKTGKEYKTTDAQRRRQQKYLNKKNGIIEEKPMNPPETSFKTWSDGFSNEDEFIDSQNMGQYEKQEFLKRIQNNPKKKMRI